MSKAYGKEVAPSSLMLTAIERTGGHYEVQEVDFGKVYRCYRSMSISSVSAARG